MDNTLPKSQKHLTIRPKRRRHISDYFSIAKSGVITGAADNDPAGIATFAQVGAVTGFSLVWLLALVTPLVIAIEEMSARIGAVTHRGLNTVIKQNCGVKWAITAGLIVLICNIATIGANIAAVAEVIGVLTHLPWEWLVIPIAALLSWLLLHGNYSFVSRYLLIVTLALLLYVITAFMVKLDPQTFLSQLWPIQISGPVIFLVAAVALIGTVISPYLIFWQTTEEVEDKTTVKDIKKERGGVAWGFIYANLIALVIIVIAATVFRGGGLINSTTQAALMLKPLAGNWAFLLFSLGIIGSGLIGIPVLAASTAYTGAEALNWPEGLNQKIKKAKGFYSLMIGSILVGGVLILTQIPPMIMLLYTQVLNGILTPILILILLWLANNKKIMGRHTNGGWSNFFGILALVVMLGFDILLLINLL